MPDDSTPQGGVPIPGPGNLWYTSRQRANMEETLRRYRQSLGGFERANRAAAGAIAPYGASVSGQMRDYLAHAVGLLRFGANVQGFEFQPSIAIIAKDLRNLANGLTNYTVPLERSIKQVMMPSIAKNFQEEGRPAWEPLDPATIQKHRKKLGLGGTKILVRTGKLKAAATSFSIWSINPVSAVVKSLPAAVWYGNIHQAGKETSGAAGSKWFDVYRVRARSILGSGARDSDVEKEAWRIFDDRMMSGAFKSGKGRANIPPRRFIVFQEEDFVAIQRIFYEWMDEEIVKRGKFVPGYFGRGGGRQGGY